MSTQKNAYTISINANNFTVTKETYLALSKWFIQDPDTLQSLTISELKNTELVDLLAMLIKNGVFYTGFY